MLSRALGEGCRSRRPPPTPRMAARCRRPARRAPSMWRYLSRAMQVMIGMPGKCSAAQATFCGAAQLPSGRPVRIVGFRCATASNSSSRVGHQGSARVEVAGAGQPLPEFALPWRASKASASCRAAARARHRNRPAPRRSRGTAWARPSERGRGQRDRDRVVELVPSALLQHVVAFARAAALASDQVMW